MSSAVDDEQQVQVRFVSRSPRYVVTDAPVLVPTSLRRFGLSAVINHLLGTADDPVPFDFIIDRRFLRTQLNTYLETHNLSAENILTIEYVESTLPPSPAASMAHDDWIADIAVSATAAANTDAHPATMQPQRIATASYDGIVRIWGMSGCEAVLKKHSGPVKAVEWLHSRNASSVTLASGGEDQKIIAWNYDTVRNKTNVIFECHGHEASVDSLSVGASGTKLASGSWDGTIKIWSTSPDDDEDSTQDRQPANGNAKRKRLPDREAPIKRPIITLDGHVGAVASVTFNRSSDGDTTLYSGGWDHSVRVWNVDSNSNLLTMSCERVVLDVAHSNLSNLLASGHTDNVVRLWDPRDQKGLVVKMKLSSHTNFVSSVVWSPTDTYKLASCSYDSTVKVWDIRSTTPLHTLKAAGDKGKKLLALGWGDCMLFSGGEGNKVAVHKIA